ncbi:MAG: hypothetical protein ACREJN_15905, partial [Nitrospiraceae bacterium]
LLFGPMGGAREGVTLGDSALIDGAGAGFESETLADSTGFTDSSCFGGMGKLTNDTSTDVNGRSPCRGNRSPTATSKITI